MRILFTIFLLGIGTLLSAQNLSNWREKEIKLTNDTTIIDTLSIVPSSFQLKMIDGKPADSSAYQLDFASALLIVDKRLIGLKLKTSYRVFPLLFTKPYYHKSLDQIEQDDPGQYDYFTLKEDVNNRDIFSVSDLNKNGSISRGVNFGNNQDLSVNSNLDLQLSGRISDEISIQAAISDNNLPIQADGNTQQLQEFDRVFIKVFTDKSSLIAGDFRISRPESYFMNFNKKVQGGGFSTEIITKKELVEKDNGVLKTSINAAISRGKFSRNVVNGEEGNQGPYKLVGDENEQFIIVLSGTERVYINGRLMTRGQDKDYVIDYNTAELTFTPNQIINKDQRIIVEFQYADQNFARSVIFQENHYQKGKLAVDLNIYSEQDSKNQPLQQDLSESDQLLLTRIGDDLEGALVSGIDTLGFDNDQVRYKQIDSLGQRILVFSKNSDSAIFAARFRFVGAGNGDYVQIQSDANGRVFEWVAPNTDGSKNGSFDPNIQLITPKRRQMVTLGSTYTLSKNTNFSIEGAFTNSDLNTFSSRDNADNGSYGVKLGVNHRQKLAAKDSVSSTFWNSTFFYEQRGEDFQFIERYRDVEFQRDWNIQGLALRGNENLINAKTGIIKNKNFLNYKFSSFLKGQDYQGFKNGYSGNFQKGGFSINSRGSFLTVDALDDSRFLRHYTTITQKIYGFKVGAYYEQEQLQFFVAETDSLQTATSFDRRIWRTFIEFGDSTSDKSYRLSYGETYDFLPQNNQLEFAQESENFDFEFRLAKNRNSRLSGKVTYRKFEVKEEELRSREDENTLLGRLNYDLKAWKGFLSSNTFYQLGSGLEFKREFSFLEVNDGQGTHIWVDFNENNIKELNEFQIAGVNNSFQANYIRVFTPSAESVRVFSNQFNQVLFLKPNALLSGKSGWKKWLAKFSNKAAFRTERRTEREEDIFNPFASDAKDSTLVAVNASFANTLYFNRINPKFGMEFFYLNNNSRSLLTNGFQSRNVIQREIRSRYNLNKIYSVELRLTNAERGTRSELFVSDQNFTIESNEIEPSFIYQPSVKFRLTVSGIYAERENIFNTVNPERSINRSFTSEFRYNQAGKSTFSLTASYIDIRFNAEENSTLAFEMLEGLTTGGNITWNILWQRNLANNLQLNLNYGGRQSTGLRVIHTGGMQVRAFF